MYFCAEMAVATAPGIEIRTSTDRTAWTLVGKVWPNGASWTDTYTLTSNGYVLISSQLYTNFGFCLQESLGSRHVIFSTISRFDIHTVYRLYCDWKYLLRQSAQNLWPPRLFMFCIVILRRIKFWLATRELPSSILIFPHAHCVPEVRHFLRQILYRPTWSVYSQRYNKIPF